MTTFKKDPEFISVGAAQCTKTPPKHIIDAYKKAIDDGLYFHYGDRRGELELREAFSRKLERENDIEVNPEKNILVTPGARGGFFVATQTFLTRSAEVITMDPSYEGSFTETCLAGGEPISVPYKEETGFRVNTEEIEERITSSTTMIIIVNPDNPTGHVYTREELEAIGNIAKKHDLMILSDEAYESTLFDNRRHISTASLPDMEDRVISLFNLKDCGCSGLRVGCTVASQKNIDRMVYIHGHACAQVNRVAQRAAIAAYDGPRDFLKDWLVDFDTGRKITVEALNKIEGVRAFTPEAGYVVWSNISKLGTSEEVWKFLVENAKVGTSPGNWYGQHGEGYLRLAHSSATMPKLREALKRIQDALEEYPTLEK